MKTFLITYDLITPGQDYERLFSLLRGWGAKKVLYSTWVVRSASTATVMRDEIKRFVDANDRVLVTEMGIWASFNAMVDINKI